MEGRGGRELPLPRGSTHLLPQASCPAPLLSGEASSFLSSSLPFCLQEPPEQVILELQPACVAVDEDFTVKCHVPSVMPLENLTLTLLQGDQELHRKNFPSLAVASQRAEVPSDRARREDDRCNFSCRAVLDVSTHGRGLFRGSSAVRVLRTFGESEPKCGRNPEAHFTLLPWPLGLSSHRIWDGGKVTKLYLYLGFKLPLGGRELLAPVPSYTVVLSWLFSFSFPHFLAEFSQSPQIWVSLLLEVGMAGTVSCEVARVFPAKEVVFCMFLGDQELSPFLSWEGDSLGQCLRPGCGDWGAGADLPCIPGSDGTEKRRARARLQ